MPGVGTNGNNHPAAITIRHLTMAYGSFVLMRDLDFKINRGDIFIIMGGSGSGKSTLLRHLIGLNEKAHDIKANRGVISERRPLELNDPGGKRLFGAGRVHRLEAGRNPRSRSAE